MSDLIHPIPAFTDNYIWLFRSSDGSNAAVVDPGDAGPVIDYLDQQGLVLSHILVTHHHADHTGGVKTLADRFDVTVYGPENSPFTDCQRKLRQGDEVSVFGFNFRVLEVPGHTLDHIAYYCETPPDAPQPLVFCGDTLFAAGCGRIFEGTPPMMYKSLQKLAALPESTRVYCTHEYTLANLDFAATAEPDNEELQRRVISARQTRDRGLPTLPSSMAREMATNPFLRCAEPGLAAAASSRAGAALNDPVAVFTTIRQWKDSF